MCILIVMLIALILVSVYTMNDYLESPVVIKIESIVPNENIAFPAVSVCMEKYEKNSISTESVKRFFKFLHEDREVSAK